MPLAWVVLTVVSVVCIDQASKAVLLSRLSLNGSVRLSRGVRLRHVVNVGWIHGVRSPTVLLLLWGVAVSSSLLILAFGEGGEGARAGVAVALGGATGNLVDRLLRGHIVDFIEIGPWPDLQRRRCGHRGRAGAHADSASHLMRPTLVTWGAFRIPSYVAMLYLGLLAGTYSAYAAGRADGMSGERFMGAILALLVPAVLGARLAFVASRWDVVSLAAAKDPPARERRRRGRVWSPGSPFRCRCRSWWRSGFPSRRSGMPARSASWQRSSVCAIGCFLNGCCCGLVAGRIPTQLLEAGWAAVLLIGAILAAGRMPFAGALFVSALAAYAAGRFLIDFGRDAPRKLGRLTVAQACSAGFVVLSVTFLAAASWVV